MLYIYIYIKHISLCSKYTINWKHINVCVPTTNISQQIAGY